MQPYCRNNSNYTFREICCAPIKEDCKPKYCSETCPYCCNWQDFFPMPCMDGCNKFKEKPCPCKDDVHSKKCHCSQPKPSCHDKCCDIQPKNHNTCFHPPLNPYICVPFFSQNCTTPYFLLGYYLGQSSSTNNKK